MNHDCTHCIDYNEFCPKHCGLAKLSRDLRNISDGYVEIRYAHFYRTCLCPVGELAKNALKDMLINLSGAEMRGEEHDL